MLLPLAAASRGEQPDVWYCLAGLSCPPITQNPCAPEPGGAATNITTRLEELGAMPVLRAAALEIGATGCEVFMEGLLARNLDDVRG